MVALPVVNQILIPNGKEPSSAPSSDDLPNDSDVALFGGLFVAAQTAPEATSAQAAESEDSSELTPLLPQPTVNPLVGSSKNPIPKIDDSLILQPATDALSPTDLLDAEAQQLNADAALPAEPLIPPADITEAAVDLSSLPIEVTPAIEAAELTDPTDQQELFPVAQFADASEIDELESEELDNLPLEDQSADTTSESIKDIAAQLQIIANRTESSSAATQISPSAQSADRKHKSESASATTDSRPIEPTLVNAEAGLAAIADTLASVELDASPDIVDLPPTHGLRKLVGELVAEAPDVVDSKTISVRFEEPHIGRVQLEMTESPGGITVNVAASDEVTLDMLNANAASLERTLRDHQIELLEIASLPMDSATYNTAQGDQQFHRDTPNAYQQSADHSFVQSDSSHDDSETAEQLDFRA